MDSIDLQLLKLMEKTESIVVHTPDQSNTDFTKALMQLQLYATKNNIHVITQFLRFKLSIILQIPSLT